MGIRFDIITLFPEAFAAITQCGVTRRAHEHGLYTLNFWNPRDFTDDPHRTVDDRPYGGGPGMVMKAEPLARAVEAAKAEQPQASVVCLTPQGEKLTQRRVVDLSKREGLILLSGRYEGVDERLLEAVVDEELSIGDYILSGGELPAMVVIDSMIRQLPGALGNEDSAQQDSFTNNILDCPHYTRPEVWRGKRVPEVLLSGDHQAIAKWREKEAEDRTANRRPDLFKSES
ncbi:MAG: tRNA (guanosine(37)-N1)-methyltransferase TrmD [Arenicellales bacterium]|jgi:tRNA (guanine37-N1)-methyltransferase|nr:tRNA (guanosine(37)-N1)-methyltransferase TrmD [Arenicellales bacterium]MDP7155561.1 tRNA (guanosine(37)-N1)-methyltransferase TrmD [Arenicellales bacterium]MDP7481428.1 tRNA (guanosine(37)-N1)-methyltransferase TrmD [Arenicellales bacterium]MEE1566651.1 tRNA (guanosine(37)-N1)-methyltransferase TrmD [Arenicellales bacterium]HJL66633.1 tRNA (guanosine(37)-N1)-methyltransferase TrmD [Arenicellales bacterium]|tara:strand:+ start:999 stop:1688 length:690 start_codon:yes stop_codon:yes gene_type:complete